MWVHREDFQYIIQKQGPQKICFGSGCIRDTSRKGMTPFMRYYTLEDYPNVASNSYNTLEPFKAITTKPCSHSISKKGYSGIARFAMPVLCNEDYPSPSDYNTRTFPKQLNKSKYPFGSTSKRKTFLCNNVPGPGMYAATEKRGVNFEHSFGGRVKMQLGVDLKCCSQNTDTCKICEKKPVGDYWHLNNKTFLCRTCMEKEFQDQKKCKRKELEQFRKIRDCSDIHRHDGTNAKIWLVDPAAVVQWTRREAYLSSYLKG